MPKTPLAPLAFTWREARHVVARVAREWQDFSPTPQQQTWSRPPSFVRSGRRGSWGVGKFYFEVRTDGGLQVVLQYDRRPLGHMREGNWTLLKVWVERE